MLRAVVLRSSALLPIRRSSSTGGVGGRPDAGRRSRGHGHAVGEGAPWGCRPPWGCRQSRFITLCGNLLTRLLPSGSEPRGRGVFSYEIQQPTPISGRPLRLDEIALSEIRQRVLDGSSGQPCAVDKIIATEPPCRLEYGVHQSRGQRRLLDRRRDSCCAHTVQQIIPASTSSLTQVL